MAAAASPPADDAKSPLFSRKKSPPKTDTPSPEQAASSQPATQPSQSPAPAAQHEPVPSATESNAHTTGTSTTLPVGPDSERDHKPEERSLAGTTKQTKSATGAGAADTKPSQAPNKPRKARPSLLARIVHVLVPCVGPQGHDGEPVPDIPTGPAPANGKAAAGPATAPAASAGETEKKPAAAAAEPTTATPSAPTDAPSPAAATSAAAPATPAEATPAPTTGAPVPAPLQTGSTHASDVDVIVPPTPTKVLDPEETEGVTSAAVVPPGATADEVEALRRATPPESGDESDGTSFTEEEQEEEHHEPEEDDEDRLILNGGAGIPIGPDGQPRPLLPPLLPQHQGRKCLVLDLDETLVHSSFKSIQQADFVVPVEIEYHWHNVYVIKRPGVDAFLKKMGEIYEIVIFTASLSKYADPVLDKLDIHRVVTHRLFRESCYNHRGNYVKDLSQLGRPIEDTIILDNSPASYIFHPNNAVPVSSWFNDPHDTELTDLCPFLADLAGSDDVRGVLDGGL